jgi:ATP-dependent RNA helicase RhlE
MTSFSELALIEPIARALRAENYSIPTPIQAAAIPPLLDGRDLLGCAQTGTGKTAAFALPILQRLVGDPRPAPRKGARVLVLAPTRELALQIAESFGAYGRHLGLTRAVIFGGVGQGPQVSALARGVDVLVATPGRLLDLMNQRHANLSGVEVLVLDEADRMLDMGFIRDIRKIVATLPAKRQTLLFSATMPRDIAALADSMLRDPIKVEVAAPATTVEKVDQWVLFVDRENKRHLLAEMLKDPKMTRTLVFTRTKHGANRVTEQLSRMQVRAEAIHGNKSQGARQAALESFRAGRTRVLVATDIAARGIDVDGITHVVNFELPNEPESYVHRIGRTARAGARGIALSFCDRDERSYLRDIERLTKQPLQVVADHPFRAAGGVNISDDGDRSSGSSHPGAARAHGRRQWRGGAGGGGARSGRARR